MFPVPCSPRAPALFQLLLISAVVGASRVESSPTYAQAPIGTLTSTAADPAIDGSWEVLPPPLRSHPILGYDSFAHRTLEFGGNDFSYLGDPSREIWALDAAGPGWTRVPARGDYDGSAGTVFVDDVRDHVVLVQWPHAWVLDLSRFTWTLHTIPNAPYINPAGLAFDQLRNRVLFAGATYICGYRAPDEPEKPRDRPIWCYLRKTWSWSLDGDSPLVEMTSPDSVPLKLHCAMFDPPRDRLIAFSDDFANMRTLSFSDPARWDSIAIPGIAPNPAIARVPFYDRAADQMVSYAAVYDIGILSLGPDPRWTSLPAPEPLPPSEGAITFDPKRRTLILIPAGTADIWEYSLQTNAWRPIVHEGPALSFHSMVLDTRADRLVVLGGFSIGPFGTNPQYYADVWTYGMDQRGLWSKVNPGGDSPRPRAAGTAIYDPLDDRMVVFGGEVEGHISNETWFLRLGDSPTWEQLTPAGDGPGVRFYAASIYDPVGHRMIVYGGSDGSVHSDEVWSLTLGAAPRWQRLDPAGESPGRRAGASAAYDSRRRRMVIFGGGVDSFAWALDLAGPPAWHRVAKNQFPTYAGFLAGCAYDSLNDRLVVDHVGARGDETWQLSFTAPAQWSRLNPSGIRPRERSFSATVSDPSRHRMLVFGGMASSGNLNDLMALQWPTPDNVTPVLVSLVSVGVEDGSVRVVWQAQGDPAGFTIESSSTEGPWIARASVQPDGTRRLSFDDPDVRPGGRYGYRLVPESGEERRPLGEIWVDVPANAVIALSAPMPDPASQSASFRVTLPSRSTGVVQILDVNGRRVASQSLSSLSPGSHLLRFDVRTFPAGLYVVQLRHEAGSVGRRLLVLH